MLPVTAGAIGTVMWIVSELDDVWDRAASETVLELNVEERDAILCFVVRYKFVACHSQTEMRIAKNDSRAGPKKDRFSIPVGRSSSLADV